MVGHAESTSSLPRTLGWAAYLGVSWTWCIGMFLPILLMRDFGVWAFAVFAIPNVVGAAAMGWVLRSREDVTRIWELHRPAVRAFTLVTIAFHCFFLGWIVWVLAPDTPEAWPDGSRVMYPMMVAAAVLVIGWLVLKRRHLIASVVLWTASLFLGVFLLSVGVWKAHAYYAVEGMELLRASAPVSLAFLAPVCVFGFVLCPYLDVTFLRARANLSKGGARLAFGVGFGVVFFSMILLTLVYSGAVEPGVRVGGLGVATAAAVLLFPHFLLQSVFTILVHLGAMPGGYPKKPLGRYGFPVLCVALFGVGFAVDMRSYSGLALGEGIYRSFMAFYGLVFPAYAWICMIPTSDGHAGIHGALGRKKLAVFATAVALASPCYWMGFIERETWWLAPGLGVVLLARLVVWGRAESKGTRVSDGATGAS